MKSDSNNKEEDKGRLEVASEVSKLLFGATVPCTDRRASVKPED